MWASNIGILSAGVANDGQPVSSDCNFRRDAFPVLVEIEPGRGLQAKRIRAVHEHVAEAVFRQRTIRKNRPIEIIDRHRNPRSQIRVLFDRRNDGLLQATPIHLDLRENAKNEVLPGSWVLVHAVTQEQRLQLWCLLIRCFHSRVCTCGPITQRF